MKIFLSIILILAIYSCENNPHNCKLEPSVLSKNDSTMAGKDYKDGFNPMLLKYDEPDLEKLNHKAYRLIISYSWDKEPWVFRFEKTKQGGTLTIQENYTKGFKKEKGVSDTIYKIKLTPKRWMELEKVFDANCFWTLPLSIDRSGLDGNNYTLEAFDPERNNPVNKEYFIATRWSPEENTPFWEICNYIESFSKVSKR